MNKSYWDYFIEESTRSLQKAAYELEFRFCYEESWKERLAAPAIKREQKCWASASSPGQSSFGITPRLK